MLQEEFRAQELLKDRLVLEHKVLELPRDNLVSQEEFKVE